MIIFSIWPKMEKWAGRTKSCAKPVPCDQPPTAALTDQAPPWHVPESASSSSKSKGPAKGRGKGKKGKWQQPTLPQYSPQKRARSDNGARTEFQRVKHLSQTTAKLALETARTVRLLVSMAVITLFVPTCSLTTAMENVVCEDPPRPMYDHIERWGALVLAILAEPKLPDDLKLILQNHAKATPDRDALLPHILQCSSVPFFRDENMHCVQIKVSSEFQHLAVNVMKALVILGGTLQFGAGPRKNLEHATQDALNAL